MEDESCPFCGRPNPHAKQHIEDMRRYQNEFQETKEHVYKRTRIYTQVVVRVVILAVLAVLSTGLFLLARDAYSLSFGRERNRSAKKYDEYSKIMDSYLEEENFQAFRIFCEQHRLDSYDSVYAPKYSKAISLSFYYNFLMDYLGRYAFPAPYTTADQAKWVADAMENFYRELEKEPLVAYGMETVEDPLVTEALDKMAQNVREYLVVYCGFTWEEADSLKDLSSARRQLLLEENLEGRLADEK